MKTEFTRQQIADFNKKGYQSVAARYARSAEQMLEQIEKGNLIKAMSAAGHFNLWFDTLEEASACYDWLRAMIPSVVFELYTEDSKINQ